MMKKRTFWLLLGLILAFSFGTRMASLGHGLPYTQVIDENGDLSTALHYLQGEIPPRLIRYHRSLIAYVNLASVGGFFSYSFLTGRVGGFDDFQNLYFSDRAAFTIATRFTFAVLTTLAILFVALTGRYISERVGLLAAGVLAVNGFFMLNSLYALPDGLSMVAVSLCLWMAMRLWHKRRARDYFIAGVSLALVMLSKLNGAAIAISIAIAYVAIVLENNRGARLPTILRALVVNRKLVWLGAGVVIGNLVFNPIPFLYPADLIWEIQNLRSYAYGSTISLERKLYLMGAHIMDTVRLMWRWLIPASFIGAIVVFYDRRKVSYWIIFSAFILLFLTTVNVTTIFYKVFYWTPWLIPMSLVSAMGMDGLLRFFKARRPGLIPAAYGVVGAIFVLEGLYFFQVVSVLNAADTRQQAQQYIAENIPANTAILTGDPVVYSVPLLRSETSIDRARSLGAPELQYWDWWLGQPVDKRPGPVYNLFGPENQARIENFDDVTQLIRDENIQYVIESDYCYGTQNRPESNSWEEFPPISPEMKADWVRVAVFSPYGEDGCGNPLEPRTALDFDSPLSFQYQVRTGPMISIYQTAGEVQ